jgi:molybdopterin-guanine dinucleotide biosynthesis protein A
MGTDIDIQPPQREAITGVILAGGMARRLGGQDKGLLPFSGRPLVEWVIEALAPQVKGILISANRNQDIYAAYGHAVIGDDLEGFQGPLAGLASALTRVDTPWVVTLPCDGPFPAPDLVRRLGAAVAEQKAEMAVATDGERLQPVYALVPVSLVSSLRRFLAQGERGVRRWYAQHGVALADFSDRPRAFANVNSWRDGERLEREVSH